MPAKLSAVETLKTESHRLRGTLAEELAAGGIQVSEDAYQLLKFHGSYEQFDRDTATERKQHGQEKEYQFMLRVPHARRLDDARAISGISTSWPIRAPTARCASPRARAYSSTAS